MTNENNTNTNQQAGADENYLNNLKEFKSHLHKSAEELLAHIDNGGNYQSKFDVTISLNGKSVTIEFHADAFNRLDGMLEEEIDEFIDIKILQKVEEIKKLVGTEVLTTYGPSDVVSVAMDRKGEWYVHLLEFGEEPYCVKVSDWEATVSV